MYFIIRFDWDKVDSSRSNCRIVGFFDTLTSAHDTVIKCLPYDEFRNAVAIVRFPKNEMFPCAEPNEVFVYDEESSKYVVTYEPYIGSQYFYM